MNYREKRDNKRLLYINDGDDDCPDDASFYSCFQLLAGCTARAPLGTV